MTVLYKKKKTTRLRVVRKLLKHISHHIKHIRQSRRTRGRGRKRPRPEESRERAKDNGNSKENQAERERDKERQTSEERRQVRNETRIPRDSEAKKLDHSNLHKNKREETTLNRFRFKVVSSLFCQHV
nr:MAG TPA: hypothetical protein [Inoviridae sp.]